jgi:hypothetical protein
VGSAQRGVTTAAPAPKDPPAQAWIEPSSCTTDNPTGPASPARSGLGSPGHSLHGLEQGISLAGIEVRWRDRRGGRLGHRVVALVAAQLGQNQEALEDLSVFV